MTCWILRKEEEKEMFAMQNLRNRIMTVSCRQFFEVTLTNKSVIAIINGFVYNYLVDILGEALCLSTTVDSLVWLTPLTHFSSQILPQLLFWRSMNCSFALQYAITNRQISEDVEFTFCFLQNGTSRYVILSFCHLIAVI